MLFQEGGDGESRGGQHPLFHQVQGDQQTTDSPISVQEGVDALKLVVNEGGPDQHIKAVAGVEVLFKVRHRLLHVRWGGRHIPGGLQGTARPANPVLREAEFPWALSCPSRTLHQDGVGVSNQAVAERKRRSLCNGIFDGLDIVDDILNISIGVLIHQRIEDILQCCPDPFDL